MTEQEAVYAELDREDRAAFAAWTAKLPHLDWLLDHSSRWEHARLAFPHMSYDEFIVISSPKRKRGRQTADPVVRAGEPLHLAARDFDRIRRKWPNITRAKAIEFAAQRHGVDQDQLGEQVRRPLARRYDRRARRP